jgi:hypothetical protein
METSGEEEILYCVAEGKENVFQMYSKASLVSTRAK